MLCVTERSVIQTRSSLQAQEVHRDERRRSAREPRVLGVREKESARRYESSVARPRAAGKPLRRQSFPHRVCCLANWALLGLRRPSRCRRDRALRVPARPVERDREQSSWVRLDHRGTSYPRVIRREVWLSISVSRGWLLRARPLLL